MIRSLMFVLVIFGCHMIDVDAQTILDTPSIEKGVIYDSAKINDQIKRIDSTLKGNSQTINELASEMQEIKSTQSIINDDITKITNRASFLENEINSIRTQQESLDSILKAINGSVENLEKMIINKEQAIEDQVTSNHETLSSELNSYKDRYGAYIQYIIGAIIVLALLLAAGFLLGRRRLSKLYSRVNDRISDTKKELQDEAISVNNNLLKTIDNQLNLIKEQNGDDEEDHSLALKIADEIVRIEKNLNRMNKDIKGLKQLKRAVLRVKDNFQANGYEIVDMLNKPYNEGLNASVTFRPDPTLDKEEKIITRIIKPQINYDGSMIQQAQIEVSQAE